MRLEDVDGLDWVFDLAIITNRLHSGNSFDGDVGKEISILADDLGGHRSLGGIEQRVFAEGVDLDSQRFFDVSARLSLGELVSRNH